MWSAFALATGVFAGSHACRTDLWFIAALIAAFSAAYLLRRRIGCAFALAMALVFAVGSLLTQIQKPQNPGVPQIRQFTARDTVVVTGHIKKEGSWREKDHGEEVQQIDVGTENIAAGGTETPLRAGVRITVFNKKSHDGADASVPLPQSLRYGQRLRFPAKLSLPRNFRNPGEFDYEGYLAENGITAIGSAKMGDVEILPGFSGNFFELWRTRIHRSLTAKIYALWPAEQASLVDTIMLGDDTFLGKDVRTNFQRTGTYHVLVVSGLKVGILALVLLWLFRRLRVPDLVAGIITILVIVFYALLTDVGTPVWRAALMLILYLGARSLYRERSILNTIGAAALILLVADPSQLFAASFQLSFLCVLIIGGIGAPLLERTTKPFARALRNLDSTSYDLTLSPRLVQFRLDLRMVAARLRRFIGPALPSPAIAILGRGLIMVCDFSVISVLLQAGFVLPMAYYFHRAAVTSLPANMAVVPLTEIIMIASGAAISLGYLSHALAKVPIFITAAALRAASSTIHWMGGLRISEARIATPEIVLAVLTCAALAFATICSRRRWTLAGIGLVAIAATALCITLIPPRLQFQPNVLEVTVIDVGQGDSILLVTPQGRTVLIDAGGFPAFMHSDLDIGEDVVSPYLWSRGISRLDAVAITHAHADHIGGMTAILSNFHPRELWLGVNSPSAELQSVLQEARNLHIPIVPHWAGETFEVGGANVRVLAPLSGADRMSSRPNDTSLVLKVGYRATSVLLEGDAERMEENLISQEQPQADLLKVAHHGSATSTAANFLASVHPRFAMVSVGLHNLYGHPRQEVLDRLAQANVGTYRTDTNGAVTFYLDGKNVTPQVLTFR